MPSVYGFGHCVTKSIRIIIKDKKKHYVGGIMKFKIEFILLVFTLSIVSLSATNFTAFSQFQKHINQESRRVIDKDLHAAIRAEKDLRDYSVGDVRDFWRFDFTIMPPSWEQAPATCRAVGEHCYVFVSDEEWNVNMNQEDLDIIFEYLENSTMNEDDFGAIEMDINLFGEIPDELDNDEKIIVYYSALGSYNGSVFDGYFSSYNQVTEAEAATMNPPGHSNECEMIYMTCSPLDPTDPTRISVLSHELQHMIHWGHDGDEYTWVDEGMAELAMVHFGMPDPINTFNGNANYSLNFWDQQWKDYVKVLLFFTYLDEQIESDDFIADVVNEQLNGIEGIANQLTEHGYQIPFETLFTNWTIANYLDEEDIYDGIYNYNSLELPNFNYNSFMNSFPDSESESVQPWAVRYVKIHHDQPLTVNITVDNQMNVALLKTGQDAETIVEKIIIDESGIIEIPTYESPYNCHTLVLTNANYNLLNYSLEINEVLETDENNLGLDNMIKIENYPNPFSLSNSKRSSGTNIKFYTTDDSKPTVITIYNMKGQKVKTILDEKLSVGEHNVLWNGNDEKGKSVSAGLYLSKIQIGNDMKLQKMMIIK
jgi:hypothetical protein